MWNWVDTSAMSAATVDSKESIDDLRDDNVDSRFKRIDLDDGIITEEESSHW